MTVTGPDVSSYQSTISMAAVKAAGHKFVICKASDGTGYVNPYFVAQSQSARQQGLVTSAYHFMQRVDGAAQARLFLRTIAGRIDPGVRVWADFEAGTHDDLHAFTTTVQAAGWNVGVYSGAWYYVPNGSTSCAHCAGLPLWQAAYQPNQPRPFSPWSTAAMWQFTDKGTIPGWNAGVDLSVAADLSVLLPSTTPEVDMTPDESARLLRLEQTVNDLASFTKWAFHPNADGPNGVDFSRPAFTTSGELAKTLRGLPGAVGPIDVADLASRLQAQLSADQAAALAAHLTISTK